MISNSNLTLLFEASHRLWTGIIGDLVLDVKRFSKEFTIKLQWIQMVT